MMEDPPKQSKIKSLELKRARDQIRILSKNHIRSFREKWFDTQDVLIALRISRRTLQKLRTQGLLPFVRLLGKLFYNAKDVNALLENRYHKQKKHIKDD